MSILRVQKNHVPSLKQNVCQQGIPFNSHSAVSEGRQAFSGVIGQVGKMPDMGQNERKAYGSRSLGSYPQQVLVLAPLSVPGSPQCSRCLPCLPHQNICLLLVLFP